MNKHTETPWEARTGENVCFHEGNRCAIIRTFTEGGEACEETIAEIWKSQDNTDIEDMKFIVRACNNHDAVVKAFGEVLDILEGSVTGIDLKEFDAILAQAKKV